MSQNLALTIAPITLLVEITDNEKHNRKEYAA